LAKLHEAGFVHRDIRLSNVVIVEEEGQEVAKWIDVGFAVSSGERAKFAGTVWTASQRALRLAMNSTHTHDWFRFYPRDDLESFFKVLMEWRFCLKRYSTKGSTNQFKDAYELWDERMPMMETWSEEQLKTVISLFLDNE
jgi:serine/threonine protein kinase